MMLYVAVAMDSFSFVNKVELGYFHFTIAEW
jgi:hypothetical protein